MTALLNHGAAEIIYIYVYLGNSLLCYHENPNIHVISGLLMTIYKTRKAIFPMLDCEYQHRTYMYRR